MRYNFKHYCKDYENIENYHKAKADDFVGWICHHRKGVDIPTEELKALGMYYHRPPEELIFLTRSEHSIIHSTGENNAMYGKRHSTEAKKKNSEAHKGRHHSEESKKKMSEENKEKKCSEETKKKMNLQRTGRHWYNNGKENKYCYECPPGFMPGMLKRK